MEINNFIVIDDDAALNKGTKLLLKKLNSSYKVNTFTDPLLGFEFMDSEYSKNNEMAILLLDISMPTMDAWEFLCFFDRLDDSLRKRIIIFILASSVNKSDMERAMSNRNVSCYIIKPMTKESFHLIIDLTIKKIENKKNVN